MTDIIPERVETINRFSAIFVTLVKQMRTAQRKWTWTRSKATLVEAKRLERRVDKFLSALDAEMRPVAKVEEGDNTHCEECGSFDGRCVCSVHEDGEG